MRPKERSADLGMEEDIVEIHENQRWSSSARRLNCVIAVAIWIV